MMKPQANSAVNRYELLKKDTRTVAAQQVGKAGIRHVPASPLLVDQENFQLLAGRHPLVAAHLTAV
ncbi:hypothetical protein ACNKHN_12385 [Shigella flexneri]